jgi:hypothetical protein
MSQTVTYLCDSYDIALETARDLEGAGIPTRDISLIASNAGDRHVRSGEPVETVGAHAGKDAGVGAVVGGGVGLLASLGLLAVPGLGPVVGLGWLAATAIGAATGPAVGAAAGGIIGALVEAGVPAEDAHVYAEGVRRGGTLVSVRASEDSASRVSAIMRRHDPVDIGARGKAYRSAGWTRFDESAAPFTAAEIERERTRYL